MKKLFTFLMLFTLFGVSIKAQDLLPLVGNWRFSTTGSPSSDGKVYSGDVTFAGQWGDMGGGAWAGEVWPGGKHTITIKVTDPLPEGFQWKVNYVDTSDDNAQYVPFEAGKTEISFEFDRTYTFLSLQWTKETATIIHVIAVERTVEGTQMKKPELSFSPSSVRLQPGEPFTPPTLNNPHGLPVTYSSTSTPDGFLTIDTQTGIATLGEGEGKGSVTATFEGNDEYLAGTATYTVTVKAKVDGNIPLVYAVENTSADASPVLPTKSQGERIDALPDPFKWSYGSGRALDFSDWSQRRGEIAKEIQHYEIGTKPAVDPSAVKATMNGNTLSVTVTVNGESLTLTSDITYPTVGEPPYALMIGTSGISLPAAVFADRPIARMTFNEKQVNGYGQFGGTSARDFERLYPEMKGNGAYSEWAWGLSRLIDGLQQLGPEVTKIDTEHIGVTGCSYAGKMALFCGAFDERVALTIAQEPGGGGAAAWRFSRILNNQVIEAGDNGVESLDRTDYNWFMTSLRDNYGGKDVSYLPYDHHELVAMICPRAFLMLGNPTQIWLADQSGYVSVNAAKKVWEQYGIADRFGYSFVPDHGHCQLPESQYPEVKAYIDRFLLGKDDVDTNVSIASDFFLSTANGSRVVAQPADLDWWMGWWDSGVSPELSADPVVFEGPAAGTEERLPLVGNWSSSVTGETESDGKVYTGTVNFRGQWGEVGTTAWASDVTEGTKHFIRVKTEEPLPEGLQWKIGYRDIYGENEGEIYSPISAGVTEIEYQLDRSYYYVAIQRMSSSSIPNVKILSAVRDVYLTDFKPTSEDLEILVDYGAEIEGKLTSENGLPAGVSLPGNWGDVKLWGSPFNINDYPRYRIELGEAPGSDGRLQMFVRNQAQADSYGGHYYPFAANQTVLEGAFTPSDLEDDPVVVQFALQNMTNNTVTTTVKDVVLYTADGTEVHTSGLVANGWNPATITPFGSEPVYEGTVNFTQQYAYVGPYSGKVSEGTYHHFTFHTDAPIPAGFQMTTVINEDVQTTPIVATGNEFSFDVFSDYSFLALQLTAEVANSIHFDRITREVLEIEPTSITPHGTSDMGTTVVSTHIYTPEGLPANQLKKGINIVRELLSNGKVRTRKIIVK